MHFVWLSLIVLFLIIEAVSFNLLTIWFAVGSLASLITSFFTDNIQIQVIIFIVTTIVVLLCLRPFAKKYIKAKHQPTNVDMNIGATGVVLEEISNLNSTGTVKVNGITWTARSSDSDIVIPKGVIITVESIEGVKLIVKPKPKTKE